MDLANIQTVKALLREHNIRPNKRLGQNFLVSKNAIKKLVAAADLTKDDTVLEVGAGIGTITLDLAKQANVVVAIEKDLNLTQILKETTKEFTNIQIVTKDILKLKIEELIENSKIGNWKLVGNIPYYLTSPLIRKFLEAPNPPYSMTLMVQKEMAQRICAKPPNMSILAVSVQVYAKPEIIGYVTRSSFWPRPAVDSAIIKITRNTKHVTIDKMRNFFEIVKAGFSSPRKQLINNLSKGLDMNRKKTEQWLLGVGIEPQRRAETLLVGDWLRLASNH